MDESMTFQIFKAFPPDQDRPVAELHVTSPEGVEVPMQVFREGADLRVTIFAADGGVAWDFSVTDLIDGLRRAGEALEQ